MAFEAALSFFLSSNGPAPSFPQFPRRRSREASSQPNAPGARTRTGRLLGKGRGMWKTFWFPPLKASGFRFHFLLREPPDLWVLGSDGAAGRVRSPPRAAGGLGCALRGKPAALGPRPLRLLPAISGARPPPGHAGQGSNKIPWEAGGLGWGCAQSNGGAAWRLFRGGETRRGHPLGELRLGSRAGAGEEATWDLGAGRLRARKCRLRRRVGGGIPILHHTQIMESSLSGDPMIQGL